MMTIFILRDSEDKARRQSLAVIIGRWFSDERRANRSVLNPFIQANNQHWPSTTKHQYLE